MTETLRWEGLTELIAKLDNLASMRRVKAAIQQAGVFLKGKLADYPTPSHRPNPMIRTNPKVRRGFFYHLKKGDIEVPYRRGSSPGSQKLGQSWNVRSRNNGWSAVVGTAASYAKLVQGSENQTSYHRRTGWITTRQAAQLYGDEALGMIESALKQEIEHG